MFWYNYRYYYNNKVFSYYYYNGYTSYFFYKWIFWCSLNRTWSVVFLLNILIFSQQLKITKKWKYKILQIFSLRTPRGRRIFGLVCRLSEMSGPDLNLGTERGNGCLFGNLLLTEIYGESYPVLWYISSCGHAVRIKWIGIVLGAGVTDLELYFLRPFGIKQQTSKSKFFNWEKILNWNQHWENLRQGSADIIAQSPARRR